MRHGTEAFVYQGQKTPDAIEVDGKIKLENLTNCWRLTMDLLEIVKHPFAGLSSKIPTRLSQGGSRKIRENSWYRLDAGSGIIENSAQALLS